MNEWYIEEMYLRYLENMIENEPEIDMEEYRAILGIEEEGHGRDVSDKERVLWSGSLLRSESRVVC